MYRKTPKNPAGREELIRQEKQSGFSRLNVPAFDLPNEFAIFRTRCGRRIQLVHSDGSLLFNEHVP